MTSWFQRFFSTRSTKPHLVFVCTANRCRSPIAEGLCRSHVSDRDWEVSSAGFFVDHLLPPAPEALAILHRHGHSTKGLLSKRLNAKLLNKATHVFVMTDMHRVSLLKQFPTMSATVYLLSHFAPDPEDRGKDLSDPVGLGLEAFEEVYALVESAMPNLIAQVEADAKATKS